MNSRKNSFKRVAASALAVLTVAAYAAPVANVGGIPSKILVAEAADAAIVSDATGSPLTKTTFEVGDYFEGAALFNVPSSTKINIVIDGVENPYNNVTKVEYVKKGTKVGENTLTFDTLYITTKGADAQAVNNEDSFIYVTGVATNDGVTTITFAKKAAAESFKIDFKANNLNKKIKKIEYTKVDGSTLKIENVISSITELEVKAKSKITIESEVLLDGLDDFATYNATTGTFTYKFSVFEGRELKTKAANFKIVKTALGNTADGTAFIFNGEETTLGAAENLAAEVGSTVTIKAKKSFSIENGAFKSFTESSKVTPKYVGVYYTATFVVANTEDDLEIVFNDHTHTLTYALSNNLLTATCTAAEKDLDKAKAAKIDAYVTTGEGETLKQTDIANNGNAYYFDDVTIRAYVDPDLLGTSGTNSSTAAENNILYRAIIKYATNTYTLTYYAGEEGTYIFTDGKDLTIESDDAEVEDKLKEFGLKAPTKTGFEVGSKAAGNAGTYNIELQVWGNNDVTAAAKKLKYKYTVKPSEKITDKDIVFSAEYTGGAAIGGIVKNADGVYEVPVDTRTLKDAGSVTGLFALKDTTVANGEYYILNTDYLLDGEATASEIGKVNKMDYVIINPNHKAKTLTVQWKLVEAVTADTLYFDNAVGEGFVVANADTLTKEGVADYVDLKLHATGNVDKSKAKFWYTTSLNKEGNIDLDDVFQGLPDKESEEGKCYYIYASVDEIETPAPLAIRIGAQAEVQNKDVKINSIRQEYTYGEVITADDIKLTADANITALQPVIREYDTTKKEAVGAALDNSVEKLVPGTYEVSFVDAGSIVVEATAANYKFVSDATDKYLITVAKRELDPTMVGDVIKTLGNNRTVKIEDVDVMGVKFDNILGDYNITGGATAAVVEQDGALERFAVQIKDGHDTAYKTGAYTVTLEPTDAAAKYYTGSLKYTWYVADNEDYNKIKFDVLEDKTNIYNAEDGDGVQLHVEYAVGELVGEGEDEAFAKWDDNTTSAKKTVNIGWVYDKTRAFDRDAKPADVAKALRVNIFDTYTKSAGKNGTKRTVIGLNPTVASVDDYVWVRPYATVNGGAPVYGDPICLDFDEVAQKVINPQMSTPEFVNKDVNGVETLCYYVYGTKHHRGDDEDRTAEPKAWGVVVDREGNYTDEFDYSKLTVNNNDAKSTAKKTTNYNSDECGTIIKITDSRSKVYVRTYVDFGNGLVVYKDVDDLVNVSAASASDILNAYFGVGTSLAKNEEDGRALVTAYRNKNMGVPDEKGNIILKAAKETFVSEAGKPQEFLPIKYNNLAENADKKYQIQAAGIVADFADVMKAPNNTKGLYLGEGFTEIYSQIKGAELLSGKGIQLDDQNKICYTAIKKPTNDYVSARGYIKFMGVTVYGNMAQEKVADLQVPAQQGDINNEPAGEPVEP